ncbi:MAG TPA: thiamine phosphate synthase [Polyangiaceae bacterium]|nr:thiamine phosphate synthase [Polyangiaceae bacterium]
MASLSDSVRLIVITDHQRWSEAHIAQRVTTICQSAAAHSVVVQLRDRELSEVERLRIGQRLRHITRQTQQGFVVSERVDLAVLLEADGVALPESGIPPTDARALLVRKGIATPWISCAWHDVARPPDTEATVCVLSPIAEARKDRAALGLDQLACFREQLPVAQRLFALGGISTSNAAACLAAGAQGVAVMGAAFDADPLLLLRALDIVRH